MKKIVSVLLSAFFIVSFVLSFTSIAFANEYYSDYESENYDFDDNISYDTQKSEIASRFLNPQNIIISLIAGAIIGLIGVSIMKSNLVSVYKREGAMNYAVQGSLKLSEQNDELIDTESYRFPKSNPEVNNQ